MKTTVAVLAAALALGASASAAEGPMSGLYVSAGLGSNAHIRDSGYNWGNILASGPGGSPIIWAIVSSKDIAFKSSTDLGLALVGVVGKKFGNGLRVELEGSYRTNKVDKFHLSFPLSHSFGPHGSVSTAAAMTNVLYDLDLGSIMPYVGGGIGAARHVYSGVGGHSDTFAFADLDMQVRADGAQWRFAYQGIAGVALPLASAPQMKLTLEYRYFETANANMKVAALVGGSPSPVARMSVQNGNQSLMFGLRYSFD